MVAPVFSVLSLAVVMAVAVTGSVADTEVNSTHLCFGTTSIGWRCFEYLDTGIGTVPKGSDDPIQGPVVWAEIAVAASEKLCEPPDGPLVDSIVFVRHGGCDYCAKASNAFSAGAAGLIIYKPGEGQLKFNKKDVENCSNFYSENPVLFMRIQDVAEVKSRDTKYLEESDNEIDDKSSESLECAEELCNFLDCGPNDPCACAGNGCEEDGNVICPDLVPCPNVMTSSIGTSAGLFITDWKIDQLPDKAKPVLGLALAAVACTAIFLGGKVMIRLRTRTADLRTADMSVNGRQETEILEGIIVDQDAVEETGATIGATENVEPIVEVDGVSI